MTTYKQFKKGFTLIELAIVLVIVGLIVSGIATSNNLIEAVKINRIYSDLSKLESAIKIYKNKYGELPGDHTKAYTYFGSECASSSGLCNGNGDGTIRNQESRKAFKHLAFANLTKMLNYELSWSGSNWDTPCGAKYNTLPAGPIGINDSYNISYTATTGFSVADSSQTRKTGNFLTLTVNLADTDFTAPAEAHVSQCGTNYIGAALTTAQSFEFDQKFDDGYARKGKIIHFGFPGGSNPGCSGSYSIDKLNYQNPIGTDYSNHHFHSDYWNSEERVCAIVMWLDDYLQKK